MFALRSLCGLALIFSFIAPLVLKTFVEPSVVGVYARFNLHSEGFIPGASLTGAGGFGWMYILFILLAVGVWLAWRAARKVPGKAHAEPYFSGSDPGKGWPGGLQRPHERL